jgi:serine/threonine protein kinase
MYKNTGEKNFFGNEFISLLSGLFEYDYKNRLTCEQVLNHPYLKYDITKE